MLGYDYSIAYRKGFQNIVDNDLSRRAHEHSHKFFHYEGNISSVWFELWDQVSTSQMIDMKLH